jgi:hypothetical protein
MAFQSRHTPVLSRLPPWLTVPAGPEAVQSRTRKQKGDLAELKVACDLRRRGYGLAIPFGEECDYDLILDRDGMLERVQVKYTESDGVIIDVRCNSHSLTNGKVRATKRYTADTIDWLAVYDRPGATTSPPRNSGMADTASAFGLRQPGILNGQEFATQAAMRTLPIRLTDTCDQDDGASGTRTRDLPDANRTLFQLSYGPSNAILGPLL